MNRYYYDLHLHSCLSPCGDNDSTPNNIAGMASLCGLNIVALTDHNTSKNCPAFFEAAKRYGLIPIAGMELTTAEEIHTVCLFEELEAALDFDRLVDTRRIKIKNRPDIFGHQLILNGDDVQIGEEENLLINATEIYLDEVPSLVEQYGGICYPAHIDRESNGVIAILGDFPKTPHFRCVELHDAAKKDEYINKYGLSNKQIIISSDAHYLTDIRDKENYFELEDEPYSSALVRKELLRQLR